MVALIVRPDAVVAVLLDDALLTCCEVSCHSYTLSLQAVPPLGQHVHLGPPVCELDDDGSGSPVVTTAVAAAVVPVLISP